MALVTFDTLKKWHWWHLTLMTDWHLWHLTFMTEWQLWHLTLITKWHLRHLTLVTKWHLLLVVIFFYFTYSSTYKWTVILFSSSLLGQLVANCLNQSFGWFGFYLTIFVVDRAGWVVHQLELIQLWRHILDRTVWHLQLSNHTTWNLPHDRRVWHHRLDHTVSAHQGPPKLQPIAVG